MKNLLYLILLLLLMSSSCKKEPSYPTYYMDQEFKDYCLFPVGSYWVYEDSVSGMIDSVYLFKQEVRMYKGNDKVTYNMEQFTVNLYSSLYNDTLVGGAGKPIEEKGYVYRQFLLKNFVNSYVTFFDTDIIGELDYGDANLKYLEFIDKYVNKYTFSNVRIYENLVQSYSDEAQKLYYSENVGLIRKELFNGQVWNLIRYKINK